MARPPRVRWHERDRCWIAGAFGPISPRTGRPIGLRNRDIGPPTGRDGAANRAGAELWHAQLIRDAAERQARAGDPSLHDCLVAFVKWGEARVRAGQMAPRTVESHRERLLKFGQYRPAGTKYATRPVGAFRAADFARFVRHCAEEGYDDLYVVTLSISIQALFNWLARPVGDRPDGLPERVIPANPFKGVERPKSPQPPRRYAGEAARSAFFRYAIVRACLRPIGSPGWRFDRLVIGLLRLCEWSGCRPSEACRLEWSHVRWEEGRAVLPGKTTRKTGRKVVVPLTDRALRMLRAIERLPGRHDRFDFTHAFRVARKAPEGDGDRPDGLAGGPWRVNALDHLFRRWRAEAAEYPTDLGATIRDTGPEALTPYQLRRDMGADILRGGGSYADVAEVLNNSAAVAERHYASFASRHALDLARKVDAARGKPTGGGGGGSQSSSA